MEDGDEMNDEEEDISDADRDQQYMIQDIVRSSLIATHSPIRSYRWDYRTSIIVTRGDRRRERLWSDDQVSQYRSLRIAEQESIRNERINKRSRR